jgi:REP element-mobilizing transposase RayT
VRFTGTQARAIGRGFAAFVHKSGLLVWSCSILPEHAHLVVSRHRYDVRQVAGLLKGEATRQLMAEGLHPLSEKQDRRGRPPSPWAARSWAVYLDSPQDVRRAIAYVEDNPVKEGLPPQKWSFVRPFAV